jgi:hypothetical protein
MRSPTLKTSSKNSLCKFLFPLCLGFFSYLPNVSAAEQISFRIYGAERSVAVADLRKLVNTGEKSDVVGGLLAAASIDPNIVRGYLGLSFDLKQFDIDVVLVDKFLSSYLVELLLQDLGKSLHPPGTDSASVEAIKGAILNSVSDDNKISLIEFLEKYPTELVIEVDRLAQLQERVKKDYANLAEPFAKLIQRLPKSP